jgi:hypothetical protein
MRRLQPLHTLWLHEDDRIHRRVAARQTCRGDRPQQHVGKPMALMLLQQNATVTICHSATADLKSHTLQADVVVAAVGRRNVLTADMVKPGAIVIDVGMNHNDEGKLCGDVDFAGVRQVAGYITPVPGGVGPMTITMLLVNTLESAERVPKSRAARMKHAMNNPLLSFRRPAAV